MWSSIRPQTCLNLLRLTENQWIPEKRFQKKKKLKASKTIEIDYNLYIHRKQYIGVT